MFWSAGFVARGPVLLIQIEPDEEGTSTDEDREQQGGNNTDVWSIVHLISSGSILYCSSPIFSGLPTFAWVNIKVDRSRVPLLCKEGQRGGSLFGAFNG
jgi:hypothetical protein